ncbi:MAG: YggS family pyridoxal phosphate-dependent enzyme [Oceanococcus sp.]|nr:MAG: YggS family pyridoxal phosphate-dependent enzyme [Oceanococcus sp.]
MTSTKLSANADTGNQITPRLRQLRERIERACDASHRNPTEISLLAVSKTQPADALMAAYNSGQRAFGENYLQEAEGKIDALPEDCEWHFIGPIQSNKTRTIAERFDWVHSVDRLKIARRLSEQRPQSAPPLKICLQVNISGEASKSGVEPDQLAALYQAVAALPQLQVMGLMSLPRPTDDPELQRQGFRQLRELRDNICPQAPVLSMGMSQDLEAAVAEGSTLLRIGTALFGPRASNQTAQDSRA